MIPHGVNGTFSNIRLSSDLEKNLLDSKYDTLIVGAPYGYSPLGLLRNNIEERHPELLSRLDEKIEFFNASDEFIITGFKLGDINIILAPNQNSKYYQANWDNSNGNWRDFTYISIYYALVLASLLKSNRLAITHTFHGLDQDYIYTMGDAIGLYSDSYSKNTISEIIVTGCCFTDDGLSGLFRLNEDGAARIHNEPEHTLIENEDDTTIKIVMP